MTPIGRKSLRRTISATSSVALVAASLTAAAVVTAGPASAATGYTWTAPVKLAEKPTAFTGSTDIGPLSQSGDQFTFEYGWNNSENPPYTVSGKVSYLRERTSPTGWGSPVQLSPSGLYSFDLAISGNGKGLVFGEGDNVNTAPGLTGLLGNKKTPSGWQTPGTGIPASDTGLTKFGPRGTAAGDYALSNAADRVVWKRNDPGETKIFVAPWSATGVAGTPVDVAGMVSTTSSAYNPFISGDGKHVVFSSDAGGSAGYGLYLATLNGNSWTVEQILAPSSSFEEVFGISYDGSAVIYGADSDEPFSLYGRHKVGGTWTSALIDDSTGPDGAPDVAQDGSLAWESYDNGKGYVSQYRNGTWTAPTEVAADIYSRQIKIADSGDAIAAMEDNSPNDVYVRNYISGSWTAPINATPSMGSYTDIEYSGNGCALSFHKGTSANELMYAHTDVPCAATPVAVASAAGASATLTWEAASMGSTATTGYELQAYKNGVAVAGKTCTVGGSVLTCTISGLTVGDKYTFKAKAKNTTGWGPTSGLSNEVTITEPPVPGKPTNVKAEEATSTSIDVSWTKPATGTAPTKYKVQAYIGSTAISGKTCTVNAPKLTCTVDGLTTGKTYRFKVVASSSGGNGAASAFSNSVTLQAPETKPCPLNVVAPRPASARLPVGVPVVLVNRMVTVPGCKLQVGSWNRGDVRKQFVFRINPATGRVVVVALVANANAQVAGIAIPKSAPYVKQSPLWKRTWRS